ncbi:MAG: hypothetical protein AB7S52_10595 [Sphaerochaetaceae bacterium]
MTLREIRKHAVEHMEAEAVRLEKDLIKMRAIHGKLQLELFDAGKRLDSSPASGSLVKQTEDLQKRISEIVVTMHHLDARISRIKHRAERLRRNG